MKSGPKQSLYGEELNHEKLFEWGTFYQQSLQQHELLFRRNLSFLKYQEFLIDFVDAFGSFSPF